MKKFIFAMLGSVMPMLISLIIIFALIISAISTANELAKKNKEDEEAIENAMLDEFSISGKKDGNSYVVKFQFEGWSIDGIKIPANTKQGSTVASVRVPAIVGDRPSMAYKFLRQKGFTPEGACGLMANIKSESANTWRSNVEEGDYNADKATISYRGESVLLKGYGLCQWTNTGGNTKGRRYKVIQHLKKQGLNPANDSNKAFMAEMQYLISEKGYGGIVERVKKSTDAAEAAKIWCVEWEIPENKYAVAAARGKQAKQYLKQYKNTTVREGESTTPATLSIKFSVKNGVLTFNGTLQGIEIAGSFNTTTVKGSGFYGEGAADFIMSGAIGNPYGTTKFYITDIACAYVPGHSSAFHSGWDFSIGGTGTPLHAVLGGTVVSAGSNGGYGNAVVIKTGNMWVLYGHMSSISVSPGDRLSRGQKIGTQGSTGNSDGPHLHLEFRKGANSISNATANLAAVRPMLQKYAIDYSSWKSKFTKIRR